MPREMNQTNAKNALTLEIDALSYGPYGIARLDGMTLMIPHTAPGDLVAVRLIDSKPRYAIGELDHVIQPSPLRQIPPCPYFSECGGCPWQHLNYDAQLKAKEKNVLDALCRIGKLGGFELRPIIPSAAPYHYRRRIALQCDANKRVGFFRAFSHDLVEIEGCVIADHALNPIIAPLRRWLAGMETVLERIEAIAGDESNQIVIVGKGRGDFVPRDEAACDDLLHQHGAIMGLILHGRDWRKTWGEPSIALKHRDALRVTVEGDVFTQVNPQGNRRLLEVLLEACDFRATDRLLELYCGAANFTLAVAKQVSEVVAVDGHRQALANAKLNAQKNDLSHIRWLCAPVPEAVARLAQARERFSTIILDPPRAGAKGIARDLAFLGARKIIYISCNPTTLARDLSAMAQYGYRLHRVQPIDLFPQTFHVEIVAELNC